MSFQIKDFASITASIINLMKVATQKITDFTEGSIARTIIEAPAAEIEELYLQMYLGIKDAIPVATYNTFNFQALAAAPATGLIRVTVTAQTVQQTIGAGAQFSSSQTSNVFTATNGVTIPVGATYVDVPVAATSPGAASNVGAGLTWTVSPAPAGFVSASNAAAFSTGTDAETPSARAARFAAFIASLDRGTVAAIQYGLSTVAILDAAGNITERVALSQIVEPWIADNTQPISLVNAYIHNGVGSTSAALMSQAQQVVYGYYSNGVPIPGWKAAGVNVQTYIATEVPINIGGTLAPVAGYTDAAIDADANAAASAYILGLGIGVPFLVDDLIGAVKAVQGVADYTPADVGAPAAPTLSAVVSGALAATTYYVKVTYVTPYGETLASAEASLAVAANSVLSVASPPAYPGATGWNVYVSTATGTETKQNSVVGTIGTPWQEPTTGLIAGSAVPAASTARLANVTPAVGQKFMPGTMSIA